MKQPQYRGVNELRRMFLEFFESKGHLVMKSFSLVPVSYTHLARFPYRFRWMTVIIIRY